MGTTESRINQVTEPPQSLDDYREPATQQEWLAQVAEWSERLPVITDVDDLAAWLIGRGEQLTIDEWQTASSRAGRNRSPWLLRLLDLNGLLPMAVFQYAVADAWNASEMPLQLLRQKDWRELFAAAGYLVDGVSTERPTGAIRLFRGCRPGHRRRWSWTPDPLLAHWFADRPQVRGEVFEVVAPPAAMLATFRPHSEAFRNESEVVVETAGLEITRHVCHCHAGGSRDHGGCQ
jgi:hypothetical protein